MPCLDTDLYIAHTHTRNGGIRTRQHTCMHRYARSDLCLQTHVMSHTCAHGNTHRPSHTDTYTHTHAHMLRPTQKGRSVHLWREMLPTIPSNNYSITWSKHKKTKVTNSRGGHLVILTECPFKVLQDEHTLCKRLGWLPWFFLFIPVLVGRTGFYPHERTGTPLQRQSVLQTLFFGSENARLMTGTGLESMLFCQSDSIAFWHLSIAAAKFMWWRISVWVSSLARKKQTTSCLHISHIFVAFSVTESKIKTCNIHTLELYTEN